MSDWRTDRPGAGHRRTQHFSTSLLNRCYWQTDSAVVAAYDRV